MNRTSRLVRLQALALLITFCGCAQLQVDAGPSSDDAASVQPQASALLPPETLSLALSSDTSVRLSSANKNFGSASTVDINRGLVKINDGVLAGAVGASDYVVSAKLRFDLVPDGSRRVQRQLGAHRVLKDWTELGATWQCAVDTNTGNNSADCSSANAWQMLSGASTFVATPSATATIPAARTGVIELDVTADVRAFRGGSAPNRGWMLKTGIGVVAEVADLASRESATPPRLVLQVQRCSAALCDDGNACTVESCTPTGSCATAPVADGVACSDGNGCTTTDACVAGACVPGVPVVCPAVDGCHPATCQPQSGTCSTLTACALYGVGAIPGTDVDGLDIEPITLEDGSANNQVSAFGSAIAYTGVDDLYIGTPDRGPNNGATSYTDRYYLIDVSLSGGTVTPTVVGAAALEQSPGVTLLGLNTAFDATNSPASRRFDPEGVRVSPDGTLFISDEYGPFVYEFGAPGERLRVLPVPSRFLITHPAVEGAELPPANTSGRQANRGMEGLAITPDGHTLFGIMQSPLIQDGGLGPTNARIGTNVRILELDTASGETHEYLYQLSLPGYGISEIVAINDHRFLVFERDGAAGAAAAFKRLFAIDLAGASDISGVASLPSTGTPAGITPVSKQPFLDMLAPEYGLAGSSFPEKIEGLAFGPDRGDGKHVLVITSDNDGITANPSRFFVFTIDPVALPDYVPQDASFPGACGAVTCDAPDECHRAGSCDPSSGTCNDPFAFAGSACSAGQCDGAGACLSCLSATDCPGTDTACRTRSCIAGACGVTLAAAGASCGAAQICDGAGNCVAAPEPVDVIFNEVESNGGVPGDWVELYNAGSSPADLSGYVFKDNDDTHGYVLPAGSVIAPGGYRVLDEASFGFGLGGADSVRLYTPGQITLLISYSWTTHATTTYGRCPNGTGPFVTTTVSTKATANGCP